ncbi:MAG: FmdB family zinc ribbon protein [Streptosporangiaceae bacterium]
MPTYQYACTECGDQLEVVQKFSDDPLTVCPACEGRLRKVFSPVGIVFKGSGFYRTDSRSGNGSAPKEKVGDSSSSSADSKTDSGSKSDSAKSDSAKSDSAKSDSAKSGSKTTGKDSSSSSSVSKASGSSGSSGEKVA